MPRVLDLVHSSLRRLKCWGKYLSPDDVRLLLASRRVLSDIEPHLNNIADRQAALLHNSEIGRHTSELQSPDHLVCRLLLEKKKIYLYAKQGLATLRHHYTLI